MCRCRGRAGAPPAGGRGGGRDGERRGGAAARAGRRAGQAAQRHGRPAGAGRHRPPAPDRLGPRAAGRYTCRVMNKVFLSYFVRKLRVYLVLSTRLTETN